MNAPDPAGVLAAALELWNTRDPSGRQAQPEVREAANTAVDEIDAMLAALHKLRQQIVGQVRDYDDAFMARLDAKYGPLEVSA